MSPALAPILLSTLFACGADGGSGVSSSSDAAAIRSTTQAAAHALGRYYEAVNDGVRDAYVSRALARRTRPGASERCRLPSGGSSTRPTVLANPVLARAAVAQRVRLASTIGAYETMLVAMSHGFESPEVRDAARDVQQELVGLRAAANTHAQGDLFLEDAVHALSDESGRFTQGGDHAERLRAITGADITVRKLIGILATDVARQRVDTVDAAALAYRETLSYARRARAPAAPSRKRVSEDVPFCSEPAIYARGDSATTGSLEPIATDAIVGERIGRAKKRLDAVRNADPASLVAALAALDDDEMRVLTSASNPDTSDVAKTSVDRLRTIAAQFARILHVIDGTSRTHAF
ncbi:MAG: hypothetical protein NVS1B2_17170 [Vulcanimicrobiaceae bacterium]